MKEKTKWEQGGYTEGKCDIPNCRSKPSWRNWIKDSYGFQGDDECIASLCTYHKDYKQFNTTEEIIKAFERARNPPIPSPHLTS